MCVRVAGLCDMRTPARAASSPCNDCLLGPLTSAWESVASMTFRNLSYSKAWETGSSPAGPKESPDCSQGDRNARPTA